MRPGTTAGMSWGTPGARHNFYKEPGSTKSPEIKVASRSGATGEDLRRVLS